MKYQSLARDKSSKSALTSLAPKHLGLVVHFKLFYNCICVACSCFLFNHQFFFFSCILSFFFSFAIWMIQNNIWKISFSPISVAIKLLISSLVYTMNRILKQSIGLLSYTFLMRTGHNRIVVPMVGFSLSLTLYLSCCCAPYISPTTRFCVHCRWDMSITPQLANWKYCMVRTILCLIFPFCCSGLHIQQKQSFWSR